MTVSELRPDVVLVAVPLAVAQSYRRGWSPRVRIRLEPMRDGTYWRLMVQPCDAFAPAAKQAHRNSGHNSQQKER